MKILVFKYVGLIFVALVFLTETTGSNLTDKETSAKNRFVAGSWEESKDATPDTKEAASSPETLPTEAKVKVEDPDLEGATEPEVNTDEASSLPSPELTVVPPSPEEVPNDEVIELDEDSTEENETELAPTEIVEEQL